MPSRSNAQQRLPFPEPLRLTAAHDREEPTLWVRRLVLWRDVASEPIQDIRLRRGLNIVWSPPGTDADALATGHAAGKTMLCRLLRYCLGEESFADPEDTQSIRRRFPGGAIGAEVRLRGQTWVVRRGFGIPRDDRARQAEEISAVADDTFRGSFDSFLDEVEATTFTEDQRALLAKMQNVRDAWQFVLAWLTRDQECRLDDLTHWRHPDPSKKSAVRAATAETRLNVLRVAIGLYSQSAVDVRQHIAVLSAQTDACKAATRRAEAYFGGIQEDLARALGIPSDQIWPPPTELVDNKDRAREAHQQVLIAAADNRIRSSSSIPTDPGHARDTDAYAQATGALGKITQEISSLRSEISQRRERIKLLEKPSADRWADVREARCPTCPYDGTRLDTEKARFVCPLPRLPDLPAAIKLAEEADAVLQSAESALNDAEHTLARMEGDRASLQSTVEVIRRKLDAHQLAVSAATSASQAAWATKGMIGRLFEVRAEADAAYTAEVKAAAELKKRQEDQVASLSLFPTASLQRWFDYLIRRIVAPEAEGKVTLDGNGLHPRIEWRGIRRSVALNSLQIVLFDLAAMLCAVEGNSPTPAFLVHDSPREGDLDPNTYARVFTAMLELGRDDDHAPFQYIVTTTTDPPELVRDRVRLQLGADADEDRLFQVDL